MWRVRDDVRCVCGDRMAVDHLGDGLIRLTCCSNTCNLTVLLERGGSPASDALRCFACGANLSAGGLSFTGTVRLFCRICKTRHEIKVSPTGAQPSASGASSSRPAMPASIGRSTS